MKKKKFVAASILVGLAVFMFIFLIFYRPVFLGGDTRYEPVLSGSMEPAIPVGSAVVIKPVDPRTLKVGDVICYQFSDSMLVTHRIAEINGTGFVTKGDANKDKDIKIVNEKDVVGSIVLTLPFIGYLGSFVRTTLGFMLLLVLPACLIIILEVRNIITERKLNQ